MSDILEIEVTDRLSLPSFVYHMVPEEIFYLLSDDQKKYDCRNQEDWGGNSPFIHTTTSIKDLKERVAPKWEVFSTSTAFLLLTIDTAKVTTKFTYTIQNGVTYFHIWGPLLADSFTLRKVDRDQNGGFLL